MVTFYLLFEIEQISINPLENDNISIWWRVSLFYFQSWKKIRKFKKGSRGFMRIWHLFFPITQSKDYICVYFFCFFEFPSFLSKIFYYFLRGESWKKINEIRIFFLNNLLLKACYFKQFDIQKMLDEFITLWTLRFLLLQKKFSKYFVVLQKFQNLFGMRQYEFLKRKQFCKNREFFIQLC